MECRGGRTVAEGVDGEVGGVGVDVVVGVVSRGRGGTLLVGRRTAWITAKRRVCETGWWGGGVRTMVEILARGVAGECEALWLRAGNSATERKTTWAKRAKPATRTRVRPTFGLNAEKKRERLDPKMGLGVCEGE